MPNRLFFVCPADGLEPIINKKFTGVNYYYKSLGNSVVFNCNTVWQIKQLIRNNNIKEIFFVLSSENAILLDALGDQEYENITKLADFYKEFKVYHKYSKVLWYIHKNLHSVLSSHLSNRVKELEQILNKTLYDDIKIGGKIFNNTDKYFHNVRCENIIWQENFHLN